MKYFKTAMITEKFRIIFFLLLMNGFMGILNAQNLQNAPEPKLSLSLSNVTLKQFFEEIQHKTDYYFSKEWWTIGRTLPYLYRIEA